jgi:hypothetical protein
LSVLFCAFVIFISDEVESYLFITDVIDLSDVIY